MSGTVNPRIHWLAAAVLVLSAGLLSACGDDADDAGAGDVEATCQLLAALEPGEDVSDDDLNDLDAIIQVAPDEIRGLVQTVRGAFEEQGAAAFDDPEVGSAIDAVGAFQERECSG